MAFNATRSRSFVIDCGVFLMACGLIGAACPVAAVSSFYGPLLESSLKPSAPSRGSSDGTSSSIEGWTQGRGTSGDSGLVTSIRDFAERVLRGNSALLELKG